MIMMLVVVAFMSSLIDLCILDQPVDSLKGISEELKMLKQVTLESFNDDNSNINYIQTIVKVAYPDEVIKEITAAIFQNAVLSLFHVVSMLSDSIKAYLAIGTRVECNSQEFNKIRVLGTELKNVDFYLIYPLFWFKQLLDFHSLVSSLFDNVNESANKFVEANLKHVIPQKYLIALSPILGSNYLKLQQINILIDEMNDSNHYYSIPYLQLNENLKKQFNSLWNKKQQTFYIKFMDNSHIDMLFGNTYDDNNLHVLKTKAIDLIFLNTLKSNKRHYTDSVNKLETIEQHFVKQLPLRLIKLYVDTCLLDFRVFMQLITTSARNLIHAVNQLSFKRPFNHDLLEKEESDFVYYYFNTLVIPFELYLFDAFLESMYLFHYEIIYILSKKASNRYSSKGITKVLK